MTLPLIIPIGPNLPDDSSVGEIQNIELWESMNRMKLKLTKTGELVMRRKTRNPPLGPYLLLKERVSFNYWK